MTRCDKHICEMTTAGCPRCNEERLAENNEKLTVLKIPEQDKYKASTEQMKRLLPIVVEQADMIAKMRKANYDAHIKQGFTPEQAIILCAK